MFAVVQNVAVTGAIVVGATAAGAGLGLTAALVVAFVAEGGSLADFASPGIPIVMTIGAIVGLMYCLVTLAAAAVTIPPVTWLAQELRLPRPLVDIAGGALVGGYCAELGVRHFTGPAYVQFTGDLGAPGPLLAFVLAGLSAGAAAGWVRYVCVGRLAMPRLTLAN